MFYFLPWQFLLLVLSLVFLGMLIWRSIHISCVQRRVRVEARYRRRRTHNINDWYNGYYNPRSY